MPQESEKTSRSQKVERTDEEWRKILTPEQYSVLRKKATERPFTGKYYASHEKGIYLCAACGNELFRSETKYDSDCGWPSFYAPLREDAVQTRDDYSLFSQRTEVVCDRCGSHLGHVFDDGPKPTGQRYCMNSVSLKFEPEFKLQLGQEGDKPERKAS